MSTVLYAPITASASRVRQLRLGHPIAHILAGVAALGLIGYMLHAERARQTAALLQTPVWQYEYPTEPCPKCGKNQPKIEPCWKSACLASREIKHVHLACMNCGRAYAQRSEWTLGEPRPRARPQH